MSKLMIKTIITMVLCMFAVTSAVVPAAQAVIIDTPDYLAGQVPTDHEDIQQLLQRDDVRQKLIELGVDPEAADSRVASMTQAELQLVQERIDHLPVGSNALAILGAVLLVLIVLEILGVTNVFTRLLLSCWFDIFC